MPKIGKAIFVSGGMHFAFTLTVGGTTYSFDEKSASSSVSGIYAYARTKQGNVDKWSLVVYSNATLTFSKIKHLCDLCAVGGGGGSGGSRAGGHGWTGWGYWSGAGGGGYIVEQTNKMLSNGTYTIVLGGGGGGGLGGSDSGTSGSGGNGYPTYLTKDSTTIISASGGNGGTGASSNGGGSTGAGGSAAYCFGDSTLPYVSGANSQSRRGGGGNSQTYHEDHSGSWWGLNGNGGATGLFVIRSTPKE